MRFARLGIAVLASLGGLWPTATWACAGPPTLQATAASTEHMLAEAAAIIDGIVVRATGPRGEPALVRPTRVYKGPRLALFAIVTEGSCDVELRLVGERVRLVLWEGPDGYHMPVDQDYSLVARRLRAPSRYRLGVEEEPPVRF